MKNIPNAFLLAFFLMVSCTQEPAIIPNAQFSSDLDGNTAFAGEPFNIDLDNCTGDFLSLYPGTTSKTTWNPDTATSGTSIYKSDSPLAIKYSKTGEYSLTLVASSSGNWGEEYLVDVYTETIIVVER